MEYFGNVSSSFEEYYGRGWPLLTPLLLVALSLLIYIGRWRGSKGVKGDKHAGLRNLKESIPHLKWFPFWVPSLLENVVTLYNIKKGGIQVLERWAEKLGLTYRIDCLWGDLVLTTDPNLLQTIMSSSDTHILNKPDFLYHRVFPKWMHNGLIPGPVNIWAPHRKIANRAVSFNTFPAYTSMMNRHSKELVSNLASNFKGETIEGIAIYDLLYSHVMKIISEMTMADTSSTPSERILFHQQFERYKELTMYRVHNTWNMIPLVWWLNPKSSEFNSLSSKVSEYIKAGILRRVAELTKQKEEEGRNLTENEKVTRMTSLAEEMLNANCSIQEICDEVMTFFVAGYEATTVVMQYFMQYLADNPHIQKTCQEELDETFDSKSDADFTMADFSELKYLERCITETLRLISPIPIYYRRLSAGMALNGTWFPKGTTFAFAAWALHRDPEHYPEPGKFDPDRFLPERIRARHPFTFLPFSKGPRNCVGWRIAMMELKVTLAWIVRHFHISSRDKTEDVKAMYEVTIFPERNYRLVLKHRNRPQS